MIGRHSCYKRHFLATSGLCDLSGHLDLGMVGQLCLRAGTCTLCPGIPPVAYLSRGSQQVLWVPRNRNPVFCTSLLKWPLEGNQRTDSRQVDRDVAGGDGNKMARAYLTCGPMFPTLLSAQAHHLRSALQGVCKLHFSDSLPNKFPHRSYP